MVERGACDGPHRGDCLQRSIRALTQTRNRVEGLADAPLDVATGRAAADDDRVPPQHARRTTKEAKTRITAPAYEKFELSVPERRLASSIA